MKKITDAILTFMVFMAMSLSSQAEELPESLQGTPETYIKASLCIQILSIYYHEDKGMELVKAVGRASYDCEDDIENYLTVLLKTPSISKAKIQSNMTTEEARKFLKANQVFEMKMEVFGAIEQSQ